MKPLRLLLTAPASASAAHAARHALIDLTRSDRVIEGSPQGSVTALPGDRATPIPRP
jgi:catabolite regulation protein CreA